MTPLCSHLGCRSLAVWILYVGNGDKADYACGRHLNQVALHVNERAKYVTGHSFNVKSLVNDWK